MRTLYELNALVFNVYVYRQLCVYHETGLKYVHNGEELKRSLHDLASQIKRVRTNLTAKKNEYYST